jgi:hypothetical protein
MAPVELPVSQVRVPTLIDRQQLTLVEVPDKAPRKMLQLPVSIPVPEEAPRNVLHSPDVTVFPVPPPRAMLAHPVLFWRAPPPIPIEDPPVAKRIASGPIAMLLVPVLLEIRVLFPKPMLPVPVVVVQREQIPIAMLPLVVVTLLSAQLPMAMFICADVDEHRAASPMAIFPIPPVLESNALHPSDVLPAIVHPSTMPATVGVASAAAGGAEAQHRPVASVEQA